MSMRTFLDTERNEVITEDDIHSVWNNFTYEEKQEYNHSFRDYLKCCMVFENGTLEEVF